jgi:hypothetical protein
MATTKKKQRYVEPGQRYAEKGQRFVEPGQRYAEKGQRFYPKRKHKKVKVLL